MSLTSGSRLGPYEVAGKTGEGGMGEVYRATDTNLKRAVAIKVLPAAVADDAERLARFQREAEVLAALNHPNIAQIYGLERAGGATALVMELVEGPTLAEIILGAGRSAPGARGSGSDGARERALELSEALGIARQIADALEAAHEQGIVHRDLKPANIKVRADGTVKVLDFGLAKAMDGGGASNSQLSDSPTMSRHMTEAGLIIGTAAYMSPEQAKGKVVDKRTDIWAFGVVLYEMLTGERLFAGETVSDILAAVLRAEVDGTRLPAGTPPAVRWLLTRCLDRDPKTRLRDVGEAVRVLRSPADALPAMPGPPAGARPRTTFTGPLVAAIVLAVMAGTALGFALFRPRVASLAPPTSGRFVPRGHVVYADATGNLSAIGFDPDRLETRGDPFPVESGVEVARWGGGASFAVSRTGTLVFARGSTLRSHRIWSVDRRGRRSPLGEPMTINHLNFSPDGRRIAIDPKLSSAADVWLMDAASGERERITFVAPGTFSHETPVWAPDGQRIAYAFQADHSMRLHALHLDGGKDEFLFARPHHHHLQDWSADGKWLLLEDGHPERRSHLVAVQLGPGNREVAVAATPAHEPGGRFSPDGQWVAYQSDESGQDEVYVASFPSPDRRRQISTGGGRFPRWSRTGGELLYWRGSTLMALRVSPNGAVGRADATPLFTLDDADPGYWGRWDTDAAGQRFVVGGRNPDAPAREIHMVLNWTATLRRPGAPEP